MPKVGSKNRKSRRRLPRKTAEILFTTVVLLLSFCLISRSIPLSGEVQTNRAVSVGKKALALTFDDGPGEATGKLLDGLSKNGVKATFFVIGLHAEKYPDTVRRIVAEGHLLGNHTYSHLNLLTHTISASRAEIEKNADLLEKLTGVRPQYFRAPHGYVSALELKMIDSVFVRWSFDTLDWKHSDADYVYKRILSAARDGAILLLHDTHSTTVEGVLRAIPELKKQGYELVRVDDLLQRNGEKLHYGVPYRECAYGKKTVAY